MFTGIIQAIGQIKTKDVHDKGAVFSFASSELDFSSVAIGDSIAVNGVCLTAIEVGTDTFKADLSQELNIFKHVKIIKTFVKACNF